MLRKVTNYAEIAFSLTQVFTALDQAHPSLHVFKREDFPERFHYRDNPRNLPIIGYSDAPWVIYSVSCSEVLP